MEEIHTLRPLKKLRPELTVTVQALKKPILAGETELFVPSPDGQFNGDAGARDGEEKGGRGEDGGSLGEDDGSLGEADEVD